MFADREGKPLKRLQEVFVILPMVETKAKFFFLNLITARNNW